MVDFMYLVNKRRQMFQESGLVMFNKDIQVHTMFSASKEGFAIVATIER